MAWAVWCSLVMWSMSKQDPVSEGPGLPAVGRLRHPLGVRCLAILYPCITCLAVLATGNHYLFDVLAGVATTGLAVVLVRALEAAWRSRDGASASTGLGMKRMSQTCY